MSRPDQQKLAATILAFTLAISLILVCSVDGFSQLQSRSILQMIESRYLFLDMAEIEQMEGLVQKANRAEKAANNPVVKGTPGTWDDPRTACYCTVIYEPDDGTWKMWYKGTQDQPAGLAMTSVTDTRHTGFAVSRDGLHWEKPSLGIVDYLGSRKNNLVLLDGQAASVVDLKRSGVPGAKRRYRMYVESFANHDSKNLHWFASDDGLRWEEEGFLPVEQLPLELAHVLYDPDDPNPDRRWKAYGLMRAISMNMRKLGVATSLDGQIWGSYQPRTMDSQPILTMNPADGMEDEDHYYGVTKYHGYYIAHWDFMYRGHNCATELAVSRDGIKFNRILNGQKVIPLGKKGAWDSSMIVVGHGFITVKGKHYLYYTGSDKNYQEGSSRSGLGQPWRRSIGLAMWRQDGFTDLRVAEGHADGWFVSKPIPVVNSEKYELWLNATIPASSDEIGVQILDAESKQPLARYAHSDKLSGIDSLGHAVTWEGSSDLSSIKAHAVRLRFTAKGRGVRLYSFGFRQKGTSSVQ